MPAAGPPVCAPHARPWPLNFWGLTRRPAAQLNLPAAGPFATSGVKQQLGKLQEPRILKLRGELSGEGQSMALKAWRRSFEAELTPALKNSTANRP